MHKRIGVAVAIAFFLRAALVTFRNFGFPTGWGGEVSAIAMALASGRGFSDVYWAHTGPTAHLLPLYPYCLSLLFLLFGFTPQAGYAAMYLNAALSAGVIFPLGALGRALFSERTATVGIWLWALWPLTGHTEARYIWSTSLLAFIATATVLFAVRGWWIALGVLAGIGSLTDASAIVVCGLSLVYLAWAHNWKKALGAALIATIIVAPWIGRNLAVFHGRVLLRSNLGLEVARGIAENEFAETRDPIRLPNRDPQELEAYRTMGEVEYNRQKLEMVKSWASQNPGLFAGQMARRMLAFWVGNRELLYLYWPAGWMLVKRILHGLPALGALLASLLLVRQRRREGYLFLSILIFFPAVYYLATAPPRYRAPIEPLMLLLSAFLLSRAPAVASSSSALPSTTAQN